MNSKSNLYKVAAIGSSALLMAGFVGYRAGALDWVFGEAERPSVMSSSKVRQLADPMSSGQPAEIPTTTVDPVIMSSSKSIAPLVPSKTAPPTSKIN